MSANDFLQIEVLTIEDVMRIAQISEATALRWVKGILPGTPQLPAKRIGRQWRIQRHVLLEHLGASPTESATSPV